MVNSKEDIVVNICAVNIKAPKYIKQTMTELEVETDSNTGIVGDFNTPLSKNRSPRQNLNKERAALSTKTKWS